jgi:hypothetical protein
MFLAFLTVITALIFAFRLGLRHGTLRTMRIMVEVTEQVVREISEEIDEIGIESYISQSSRRAGDNGITH